MDLALVACATGNIPLATKSLQRLLEFSPDDRKARQLLSTKCGH
jgi:Flp pilus assembly protein TadD